MDRTAETNAAHSPGPRSDLGKIDEGCVDGKKAGSHFGEAPDGLALDSKESCWISPIKLPHAIAIGMVVQFAISRDTPCEAFQTVDRVYHRPNPIVCAEIDRFDARDRFRGSRQMHGRSFPPRPNNLVNTDAKCSANAGRLACW